MGLRLLGPLELAVGRRMVSVGGPRQRVVLSVLALNANRVVPVDMLVDALWAESPPSTARAQIQTCISSLRKLFGGAGRHPGVIQRRAPGYLLEIASGDLDSQTFTDLVAQARGQTERNRAAAAAGTLRTALALWRGPMLADVDSDLVRRGAALFEARRLAVLEERVRLDLALGRHEEIHGELAALVAEHPLNERLAEARMLALYRSGRQADALEVARRTRAAFVTELGLEPGHDLSRLETAILNRDPTLDLAPVAAPAAQERRTTAPVRSPADGTLVPRQLPASIADFTGRDTNIAEIKRVLTAEQGAYAMRIVAISGKGGVGKSTLAVRAAHELEALFPDGLLYGDLQNPAGLDDPAGTLLTRFLRSLGVSGAEVPDDPQERAEMYRSMLAGKRVLVVLDDVTSEEQIRPLLPGSSTCAVITTSRMLLSGLFGAHWVAIDVLDTATSMGLLAKIIGPRRVRAEPTSARELVAMCDGLPLALRIAGARLASRPHWRIAALVARLEDEVNRLDEFVYRGYGLRFNIDLTYRSLAARTQRLFRLFALVRTPDFPAWVGAALLDTDLVDAAEVLEQLVDAQLLDAVEYPGEEPRFRFHSLIRLYAMERLVDTEPAEQRDLVLTRVLGAWLAVAEDAHREEFGEDRPVPHGAARRWRPPAGESVVPSANPMDWWDAERAALVAVVRQAAAAGLHEVCWDLALTAMPLFEVRGYHDHWRETATLGLDVTRRAGNRVGQAAMLCSLGTLHLAQKRLPEAEECLAEALEIFTAEGNDHGQALVLRALALLDGSRGDPPPRSPGARRHPTSCPAVADNLGENRALHGLGVVVHRSTSEHRADR